MGFGIENILGKTYYFANSYDHIGKMTFGEDGKILDHNHSNEHSWTFEDGCLYVWSLDKMRVAKYDQVFKKKGKWHLEALFDDKNRWKHYLTEA